MEKSYDGWSARDYLEQYYSTSEITMDESVIAKFVVEFLAEKKQRFDEMLEVGCGPTIHHAFPFAPYVGRLYMADYLQSNLQEVQRWIEGNGHNWKPYLTGVLTFEDNNSEVVLAERIQMLKEKIAGFIFCNVLDTNPLGQLRTFPLVTSFYCMECVQKEKLLWKQAMMNVSSLVAPEGYLILSALRNADKYLVCGKEFPATYIDEHDMRETLIACGFTPATISIEVHSSGWGEEGFDTIIVCSAQKDRASK